jgi:1,4-alpha-glucan branching enzyme
MEKQEKFSLFSEFDVYLFKEGTHYALYEKMGAHPLSVEGRNIFCSLGS